MYLANARLVVRNAAKTYIANRRLDLRNAANSLQIEGKGVLPGPIPLGGVGTRTRDHIYTIHMYIYIYSKPPSRVMIRPVLSGICGTRCPPCPLQHAV